MPFCMISAAAKKAVTPGDSVSVAAATYWEQVTVAASGTPELPISFTATEPGVPVLGTKDVSDPATWSRTSKHAWQRLVAVPSAPRQVFVDGARLDAASSATTTTAGSFYYNAAGKVLDVDATPIATYRFDCGNGTLNGPQAGSRATCTYPTPGTYTVNLTVADTTGHESSVTSPVTVRPDQARVAQLSTPGGRPRVPSTVLLDASASTDVDKSPNATDQFTCGNGTTVAAQSSPLASCRYTKAGTYTVRVVVTDTVGLSSTAQAVVRTRK